MTEWFKRSKRGIPKRARRPLLAAGSVLAGLAVISSASAQYIFDPSNADEQGGGIKYFGSAKDDRGSLVPGATIQIAGAFTLVTDEQGRYRGFVNEIYPGETTPIVCFKPGYAFVRVIKRPGPAGGVAQTFQADCILHKVQ
jgi:hypothetical protein